MQTFKKIIKRNGRVVNFNPQKITIAILKAGETTQEINKDIASKLTIKVVHLASNLIQNNIPTVEKIQDIVEEVLLNSPYKVTAKAYIIYREQHTKIREITSKASVNLVDSYLKKIDWQINENSNMSFSLQGLNNYISSEVSKIYWLNKIYPSQIKDAHMNGDFHIHDLSLISVYCAGHDLYDLLIVGIKGVSGKIESGPAKHFGSAISQVINFFYLLQGEAAGAQAFSNFDTLLAPFIRYDKLNYIEVKQILQRFLFHMNLATRIGFQTPFTNITLDLTVPSYYANQGVIIGGKVQKETYKEFTAEINILNKALLEVMLEGDAKGRVFTFPIPTYNITKDFDWDNPNLKLLWEMTGKYGVPYFSNFINSDMTPEDARSMCVIGSTKVKVRWSGTRNNKTEEVQIKDLIEKYKKSDYLILTSQGYRSIKRTIVKEVNELVKIILESSKELTMSLDHPHLIYIDNCLKIILAKDLKVGMECSVVRDMKGKKGPNYGYRLSKEKKEKMSKKIKKFYQDHSEKKLIGEKNGWYGKHHSSEAKLKMSLSLQGHFVSENCKQKSSKRWKGLNNPVTSQKYWDRKKPGDKQCSPLEEIVLNFALAQGYKLNKTIFYQKVFFSSLKEKVAVVDFFIPNKNLILEVEKCIKKEEIRFNNPIQGKKEHFKILHDENHIDVCYFNPTKGDGWKKLLNKVEKIVSVTFIKQQTKVYDVEIQNEPKKYQVNNFYANNILTHNCCRLRIDNRELIKRGGGLFGSNPLTGSIGVVTINMPRLGYISNDEDEFFNRLESLMISAKNSLEIKRKVLEEFTNGDLYPYTKFYLRNIKKRFDQYWKNHFSTIGLIGMNEACLNLLKENITTKRGNKFTLKVLDFMRKKLLTFQKETNNNYNLEASPAEGATYRLALLDKKQFPGIICANEEEFIKGSQPFYTNSTHIPVDFTDDPFEVLELQDKVQTKYSGGTVIHLFLGERIKDMEALKNFIKKICNTYKLPYFSITPTFSICPSCGYLPGEVETCPNCKNKCEIYSRVVGYLRPINQWNKGKKEEFKMRKTLNSPTSTKV